MLSIIEKFKNQKTKSSWKIGTHFGTPSWKIGTAFDIMARQIEKLAHLWHIGKFIGTLAHGHVDHAGTYGKHGTRFRKLRLWESLSSIKNFLF